MSAAVFRTLAVAGIGSVVLGLTVVATLAYFATTLPPMSSVGETPQASLMLEARNGEVFGYRGILDGPPVESAEMPDHLLKAVIAIEDRRFYYHFGVDFRAIARAAIKNLRYWEVREGGSTITQQLAKIEYLTSDRSLARKIQEALIAIRLERHLNKKQILETYLNKVYFGAGAYGVTAAAQRYFGKPVAALTLPESAMLAGLIRSPSRLAPTRNIEGARARARLVLKVMAESGFIEPPERQRADTAVTTLGPSVAGASGEGFFADWIQSETRRLLGPTFGDFTVRTTLNPGLQAVAERVVAEKLSKDGAPLNVTQAALVAMSVDGAVIAMVGGRDYRASQFNRVTQSLRQPGSLFKLFVYQAALENGFSPRSILVDRPVKIGKWSPKNFTKRFRGRVTLEKAFARSINTVAAQLVDRIGPNTVAATAKRMGIRSRLEPTPSLALGTSETTLLEMTGSYASILRGTTGLDPYGIEEIRSGNVTLYSRSLHPREKTHPLAVRDDIVKLLRSAVRSGTGRRAAIDQGVAGKTGTSQGHKDAWFVGFTPKLAVGVWVGNDDNAPMKGVTGGTLPAEIWRDFVIAARELGKGPHPAAVVAGTTPPKITSPTTGVANHADAQTDTPDLAQKNTEEAIAAVNKLGLQVRADQPDPKDNDSPVLIAEESIAKMPDTARQDKAVSAPTPSPRHVTVALIPDLARLTARDAARMLKRRGLGYRAAGSIESPLPLGTIAKQVPPPGQRVVRGVNVSVWTARPAPVVVVRAPEQKVRPRPAPTSVVPQLASLTYKDAAALLRSRGLRYRRAGTVESKRPRGTVAGQEPQANSRVRRGTEIAIWTARAPVVRTAATAARDPKASKIAPRPRRPGAAIVPRLAGLKIADARALLKRRGLRFRDAGGIESRQTSGTIVDQKPGAGRRIPRNAVVSVWSARTTLIEVPDLISHAPQKARAILKSRGLRYRAAGSVESGLRPGRVASQMPGAGSQVPSNTVVSVWAARTALVEVPDLSRKTSSEAMALLKQRGLGYRAKGTVQSDQADDTVANQTPTAGTQVPRGTEVSVFTARASRVVVPNISQMIPLEARLRLRQNGLTYRMAGSVESNLPSGWIAKQSPKAGQRVSKSAVVLVWTAREPLVEVPNLAAITRHEAVALLQKRGLRYRVAGMTNSDLPWGWIAQQKPAAGKRVSKNATVTLWTARPALVVGTPRVESTSTLWFGGRRVQLYGIRGMTGRHTTTMASYIQGRRVVCKPTRGSTHRCEVDGYDLSEVVLFNGGGVTTSNAPRKLMAAEARARRAGRGIWSESRRPAL